VIEERYASLQPPRHSHVVDPLDRVVHEHHLGVEPQRRVHRGGGTVPAEARRHELPADVGVDQPLRSELAREPGVRPVEKLCGVRVDGPFPGHAGERWIPAVAGQDLVRSLPRLYDLHML
jgi:hypothetical protein